MPATWLLALLLTGPFPATGANAATGSEAAAALSPITVRAIRVANERPAGTFATVATTLRFDPATELQSRGLPEGQADVSVRGGLFENTGFKLGAMTVMDPQTGHYTAGLPVDPALLSPPEIALGVDNALAGFNATVATVAYDLLPVRRGGEVLLGAGSDALHYQRLRLSHTGAPTAGATLGAELSLARSAGDGDVPNGDHRFRRYNLRLQRAAENARSDLVLARQEKFYGWPGAYTGFPALAETDDTRTNFFALNHRAATDGGWYEIGGYYRRLVNDYDFDRTTQETGVPGAFEHETRIAAVALQGLLRRGAIGWRYGAQLAADHLVRSTDLINGAFDRRTYLEATLVPTWETALGGGRRLTWRAGASLDGTNRDGTALLPLFGVALETGTAAGGTRWAFDYAATSQVPGYTALASPPAGLFGGNPELGRERADQFSLSFARSAPAWSLRLAAFYRVDDDLVDWTFASGAPFLRRASPVDIDTLGVESLYTRSWESLELVAAYRWLDKDADYGRATVDASYYALNFARHRLNLALRWRLDQRLILRWDNEYRVQEENALRASDDRAYLGSLSLAWEPPAFAGVGVALAVDNLADSDFQPFPGTPAIGRQVSVNASYRW